MTLKKLPILAAGLLGLVSSPAWAAEACEKAVSQAAIDECFDRAAKAADARLNQLYAQMLARLKNPDNQATRKHLVAAQRAWIAYRDAECGFAVSGMGGGSAMSMLYSTCMEHVTSQRVADFGRYLSCPEGDLSCPLPPG